MYSFQGTYSDEIHEILLTSPYSLKLLGKLPKPIGYHGAELVNNTVFIFGGKKHDMLYDDISAYDLIRNECRIISKLPYPLCDMSTVQLEHKVNINFQTHLKSMRKKSRNSTGITLRNE